MLCGLHPGQRPEFSLQLQLCHRVLRFYGNGTVCWDVSNRPLSAILVSGSYILRLPLLTQFNNSTDSNSAHCFKYSFTDIGAVVLGCTTAPTTVMVQASSPAAAAPSNSSPGVRQAAGSLPSWVSTSFDIPTPTSIVTGSVTVGAAAAASTSASDSSSGGLHVNALVGGLSAGVLGLLLLVGLLMYFCLRKRRN